MKKALLTAIILFSAAFNALAQDDWNSVLDRYEDICNSCIELREMLGRGESVPYSRISSVLEEMNLLKEKLDRTSGSMTPAQKKRFADIKVKYTGSELSTHKRVSDKDPLPEIGKGMDTMASQIGRSGIIGHSATKVEKPVNSFRFGARVAAEISPDMQFGLLLSGRAGRWGGYVWATSDFRFPAAGYSCTSDGKVETGGMFWGDGSVSHSAFCVSAGPEYLVGKHFGVFAGGGYWSEKTYWRDINAVWAKVDDLAINSLCIDAGLSLHPGLFRLSPARESDTRGGGGCSLCLSAGVRYILATKAFRPVIAAGLEF